MFVLPKSVKIVCCEDTSPCYRYAVAEMRRLLGRLGVASEEATDSSDDDVLALSILHPNSGPAAPTVSSHNTLPDGYVIDVADAGVTLASETAKGILNAVYDLAERLGFLFLMPGEEGEWPPSVEGSEIGLPVGETICNPRFKFRGVFGGGGQQDFSQEEWLRYFAKLRFNAVSNKVEPRELAEELGLRLEIGGHGLAPLLPRELFQETPEMFRMVQPEDFYGERQNDWNCCVSHPKAKEIIQQNYRKQLQELDSYYASHTWPDDLPGGGWCWCPSCRSLSPSDQAVLAMRHLAEVIAEDDLPMRVPVLAYHDTMYPGDTIGVTKEMFLLYAPRERCYAHALDDESCPRNRFYFRALQEWMAKFDGVDDAHTFEYYLDQILFRGLYPFVPEVILQDMQVYHSAGIESHMSLQVGGPVLAPEFNLLVFAAALWDGDLDSETFISRIAERILPEQPNLWLDYLTRRAAIFHEAMQFCEHSLDIYLDYRWLPENTSPFGKQMAETYARIADDLEAAVGELVQSAVGDCPERVNGVIRAEVTRARCEAAELRIMSHQQVAANRIGEHYNTVNPESLAAGLQSLNDALRAIVVTRQRIDEAGLPEGAYHRGINDWLEKEFREKIARWT